MAYPDEEQYQTPLSGPLVVPEDPLDFKSLMRTPLIGPPSQPDADPTPPRPSASTRAPALRSPVALAPTADANRAMGDVPTYSSEALRSSAESAKAHEDALALLRKAQNNGGDISPSQAAAAAILAAIPTIGGYVLGKSIGTPKIPEGTTFPGMSGSDFMKTFGVGGNYVAAAGAKAGGEDSAMYTDDIEKRAADNRKLNAALGEEELKRSEQLAGKADAFSLAGLNANEAEKRQQQSFENEKAMLPLREASEIRVANARDASKDNAERLPPDVMRKIVTDMGYPEGTELTPAQLRVAVSAAENKRKIDQQNVRNSGELATKITDRVIEKVSAADALESKQERLRQLYIAAAAQIGPGFAQAYARKGVAALPGNIQSEFAGTLESVAMELNKAVDPTPSDAGKAAQQRKLEASIANGHFLDALDFDKKSARIAALDALKPLVAGDYPNAQAKSLLDAYSKQWGLNATGFGGQQPDADPDMERIKQIEALLKQ